MTILELADVGSGPQWAEPTTAKGGFARFALVRTLRSLR